MGLNLMNKKAQALFGLFIMLIVIFLVAFVVYLSSIPKQNTSNINTIILQNNSNYTNQTPIRIITQTNYTNITKKIKPKYYNIYENLTLYPDKRLVTGDILERNKSIICKSGYSSTVRNVPTRVRKHILYQYGLNESNHGDIEIDHWIALENSGGNNETNLWVMYAPYYKWKDIVENLVHKKLCSTNLTIETAGELMWIWYDIYKNNSIIDDYINDTD